MNGTRKVSQVFFSFCFFLIFSFSNISCIYVLFLGQTGFQFYIFIIDCTFGAIGETSKKKTIRKEHTDTDPESPRSLLWYDGAGKHMRQMRKTTMKRNTVQQRKQQGGKLTREM